MAAFGFESSFKFLKVGRWYVTKIYRPEQAWSSEVNAWVASQHTPLRICIFRSRLTLEPFFTFRHQYSFFQKNSCISSIDLKRNYSTRDDAIFHKKKTLDDHRRTASLFLVS
jgi:hypothetical protein